MEKSVQHETVFDSDQQYLGSVYAKALLGVGVKHGNIDQLLEQLQSLVVDVLPRLPRGRAALESPRVPLQAKSTFIDRMFADRASQDFVNFLKVLCRSGRFNCIGAVHRAAQQLHNQMAGRIEATLITAEAADAQTRDNVQRRLETAWGKSVQLSVRQDPQILGGMVIRVGDTVYDSSLTNALARARDQALQRANREIRQSLERFVTSENM